MKEIERKNGRPHGIELFGSIPAETTNRTPSLLRETVVRQAYFDFLQWQERVEGDAWACLSVERFGASAERFGASSNPTTCGSSGHLQRAAEAPDQRLEELEHEDDEFDDAFRRRLIDEWFENRV